MDQLYRRYHRGTALPLLSIIYSFVVNGDIARRWNLLSMACGHSDSHQTIKKHQSNLQIASKIK